MLTDSSKIKLNKYNTLFIKPKTKKYFMIENVPFLKNLDIMPR